MIVVFHRRMIMSQCGIEFIVHTKNRTYANHFYSYILKYDQGKFSRTFDCRKNLMIVTLQITRGMVNYHNPKNKPLQYDRPELYGLNTDIRTRA